MSGAAAAVRRSEAGNSLLVGYVTTEPRLRRQGRRRAAARLDAGRPRPAAGGRRHPPDPHLREDRPRRPALAAAPATRRDGIRRRTRVEGTAAWVGGPLDRHPRWRPVRPRRRLLRPRWRQPDRRPARRAGCASASPRSPSPTSTTTRASPSSPRPWTTWRPRPAGRTPPSSPCRSRPRPPRCSPPSASAPSARCAGSPGSAWEPWCGRTRLRPRLAPGRGLGLGAARLAAAGQPARPHRAGRRRRPGRAPRRPPRPAHPRRQRAPAPVVGRAARRRARRHRPVVGAARQGLRPTARVHGRPARRPAQRPPGHRAAHPGQRLLGRARGRPRRALARRWPPAHRLGAGRRQRPRRRPQHPAARRGRRRRRRGRSRLRGVRSGPRRGGMVGRPGPVLRQGPRALG